MSREAPRMFRRDPTGYWILKHPTGQYVGDTKRGFWTPQRVEAMRFLTRAEAEACAAYLRNSITGGLVCHTLLVEPLFQM